MDSEQLINEAWAAHYRDPMAIGPLAERLIDGCVAGSVTQGWGYFHRASSLRFRREVDASLQAITLAEEIFSVHGFERGLACCRELRARHALSSGNEADVRELLAANARLPHESRSMWERLAANDLQFAVAHHFSGWEEGLRLLSRSMREARLSNDEAVIGQTLSMLGGKHAELNNFDTALLYCREAYERTQQFKPAPAWYISALNLLLVYNGMADAAAARCLADELLAVDELIYPLLREQSNLLYARAFLLDGDLVATQAALDRSVSAVAVQTQRHAWVATQAGVWIAQAEHVRARALCEQWITSTPAEVMARSPSVALRVHRVAAQACEADGDLHAALAYERAARTYGEAELGRAAQARRVALEIEFDIERERWAREAAEHLQAETESERARLDELNQQLDAALQTRTRFLAAASHDLRQPAHALALYAVALEQETSRDALHALARRMRATVNSLSGMFDGLIDLARLDAGAIEVRPELLLADELLSRLCAEYGDRMRSDAFRLALRPSARPLWLHTDVVLLERVLRNLIANAVKYAGDSNILVAVRRWKDNAWAIEVRDSGPGIAMADQARVFDEFFQTDSALAHRDGLGLGLAIVRRLARLLGMQVSLQSMPGRGSTFRLEIPVSLIGQSPVAAPDQTAPTLSRDHVESLRLLVIDDDADARESLALVLRQWGHEVSVAADMSAAIEIACTRDRRLDAVISDYQLAEYETGAQAITRVRELAGVAVPALVVSGAHDEQTRATVAATGAAYLPKPVRPLRLKSWLATITRRPD